MNLDKLKEKKVLILGFGREGVDTFKFLRRLFPVKKIGIADVKYKIQNTKYKIQNVRWHLGKNYLKAIKKYDIIIKSPGIPFKILPRPVLGKITTQTEIFFENCSGKIVGITGTKGKSTTSSLIYEILKSGGKKAHLIGNIEKPVLEYLSSATTSDRSKNTKNTSYSFPPSLTRARQSRAKGEDENEIFIASLRESSVNDVYVYELSSHQLYNLKKSPHIAVLLNIYPEHLDYYRNFKEYANAKANITKYQTKNDYLVYNSGDKNVREIAKKSKAKRIPIKGEYYSLDKAAAKAVGKIFKVPSKIIEKVIKGFKPLPHRLELVGKFQGITFYNDALATIPEATIGALEVLGDRVETIMLGGYERNIDFKNLAKKVLKTKIKVVILFPTTGRRIWQTIKQQRGVTSLKPFFVDNMMDAVKLAYLHTQKGKICLLSTASPSFSIFRDYKEKGNLFKKQVFAQRKRRWR